MRLDSSKLVIYDNDSSRHVCTQRILCVCSLRIVSVYVCVCLSMHVCLKYTQSSQNKSVIESY